MALIRPTHNSSPTGADNSTLPELIERLAQGHAEERRLAARELARFSEASAVLASQLEQETEATVASAMITSLATLGDATAVAALLDCLRSEDAALRNDAIEALKTAGANHPALIQDALADSDADVRILAISILESLKHADVELWLIDLLEHDDHVNVCACAVDLLCEVGSERAIPALNLCLQRFADEDYLRFAIGLALQRLQGVAPQ